MAGNVVFWVANRKQLTISCAQSEVLLTQPSPNLLPTLAVLIFNKLNSLLRLTTANKSLYHLNVRGFGALSQATYADALRGRTVVKRHPF